MIDYILDQLKKITGDSKPETIRFVKKAAKVLGEQFVLGRLSEAREGRQLGTIDKPAQWLSKTLKFDIQERGIVEKETPKKEISTYFPIDTTALFSNFRKVEIPRNEDAEKKIMQLPYSEKHIPWITTLGPEFFTLSSNKQKSDEVEVVLRTIAGESIKVKMFRGRMEPGTDELGIMTVRHAKMFAVVKQEWAKKGCEYLEYKNRAVICVLNIPAKDIVKSLGLYYNGSSLKAVTNLLTALRNRPYYVDLTPYGEEGFSLNLLDTVQVVNKKTQGGKEKWYHITFSPFVSAQLLRRHVVGKSKDLVTVKSELGFLIKLYIEPRVLSLKGSYYIKTLKGLIEDLCLPKAGWHDYPAQRKREIEKAIKEIDGSEISNSRVLRVKIQEGKDDYLLVAYAEKKKELLTV